MNSNLEKRFKYYLGNNNNIVNKNIIDFKKFNKPDINLVFYYDYKNKNFKNVIHHSVYFLNPNFYLDINCLVICGDKLNTLKSNYPILTKCRKINDKKHDILMPFNYDRHWKSWINLKDNINFNNKINDIVWRGASTGGLNDINYRILFCKLYSNKYNVGICTFCHGIQFDNNLFKETISIDEMLKYKYIISLPGNDKDSGLAWKLGSNSLVIMPKPSIESWLMEGLLIEWVHYVPLNNNLDNLEDILKWCRNNNEKCIEINNNAKNFMKQFNNIENEKLLFNNIKNQLNNIN